MVPLRMPRSVVVLLLSCVSFACLALAREIPPYQISLLSVKMETRFVALDKYISEHSLVDVASTFAPVKREILSSIKKMTATDETALTALHTFQSKINQTVPGFHRVDATYLTDAVASAVAVRQRWAAMYGIMKSLCDPFKNDQITIGLDQMDKDALEYLNMTHAIKSTTPAIETFLNYLDEIKEYKLATSLPIDTEAAVDKYNTDFKALEAQIMAKLESKAAPAAAASSSAPPSSPAPSTSSAMATTVGMAVVAIAVTTVIVL